MRPELAQYRDCNYIDEIYEYSAESFEFNEVGMGGFLAGIFLSSFLLIINLPFRIKTNRTERIAIARGREQKRILERAIGRIPTINDDIKNRNFTLYRIGGRRERLRFFKQLIANSLEDKKAINSILGNITVSQKKKIALSRFFNKRIAHTNYFKWAIESYVKETAVKEVYVSYTHDRFALATEQICNKNNVFLTCIPHGEIENTNLPRRYPGDRVYLLNELLVRSFNHAYQTNAYVYDYEVLKRIYQLKCDRSGGKVVFLLMPHFYVAEQLSVLEEVSSFLNKRGERLYVKQHPTYRYDITRSENIEEIEALEDAVCNNFCIGFFTTALIDAVFNGSETISILKILDKEYLYQKNKDVFEGCGVVCVSSRDEIFELIDQYLARNH